LNTDANKPMNNIFVYILARSKTWCKYVSYHDNNTSM